MKLIKLMMVFVFTLLSTSVLAYGGGSSEEKACDKPSFTEFTPAHLAVVSAQSEFSFLASALTNPKTIDVSVKKITVEVEIEETNMGYLVTGTLPESLQSTYARVSITATGTNNCMVSDGWLLKIE